MAKKDDSVSNDTHENVDTFKVDVEGTEVEVKIDEKGQVVVDKLPEGVEEEALNTAVGKHKELNDTLAKAKKVRFDQNKLTTEQNKRKTELDEGFVKLKADRADFDKQKSQYKEPTKKTDDITLLTELGVETYAEVNNIHDDNPELFYKAQDRVSEARISRQTADIPANSLKQAQKLVNESILDKQLIKENIDPATVKSYLKAKGAKYNEFGIEAFKKIVLEQSNLSEDYRKLEDKPKVIITPKSELRPAKPKKLLTDYSDEEVEKMIDKEPEKYEKLHNEHKKIRGWV